MGLFLRRREDRRAGRDEESARRQRGESRRNGLARPAGSARVHHHDRSLHLLLRQRQDLSRRTRGRGRRGDCERRAADRAQVRRRRQSVAGFRALGRARLDAGHDGHRAQSRPQRPIGDHAGQDLRRRALRLRQLPPLHPDVLERRARGRQPQFRGDHRGVQGPQGPIRSTPTSAPPTGARSSSTTRTRCSETTGKPFPQDAEGSALGRDRRGVLLLDERARDHLSPAQQHSRRMGHRRQRAGDGVRQHGRDLARPASPSPAIPRPAPRSFTASSSSTRRARTSSRASARRRTSPKPRARRPARIGPRSKRSCRRCSRSSSRTRNCSRSTTRTCRTSSSPSSAASSGCCRPATASAPRARRCASRSRWPTKG